MKLTGITWSHSRGYTSIVAASQRYQELHPELEISWEKRSLQSFADQSIRELAEKYDLLIIDHPWTGFGAAAGVLLDLQEYLPAACLQEQERNSVGQSYASYHIDGKQVALPIDAAAPIAVYRPDLIGTPGHPLPQTWEDVLQLAKMGAVLYSANPLYSVTDFYMFCAAETTAFFTETEVVEEQAGVVALERLRELASYCNPVIFEIDPIQMHEMMGAEGTQYAYCPFVFGYSNYSRRGYCKNTLKACNPVSYRGHPLRTILGGTGLAVSSQCASRTQALDFTQFVADAAMQKTIFFDAGGQPGHRQAWLDEEVNRRSLNFFRDTLQTLDQAIVRPRYNSYLSLQDRAGPYISDYIKNGGNPRKTLAKLNDLYHQSKGI